MTREPLSRRRFLTFSAAGAATLATARFSPAGAQTPSGPRGAPGGRVIDPFTLGVASGDPTPSGAVLWTRLAPDPLNGGGMPDRTVPVQWQVATDEGFRRVVARGTEQANSAMGHSVHAEVDGLDPGAWYWYRFRAADSLSPVGRTRTAPALGASVASMAFGVTSCHAYPDGFFTAHGHMAEEDLDLVVQLGDYIYEGAPNLSRPRVHEGDSEPVTLVEYRTRHAQ